MKELGYGKNYAYDHDAPDAFSGQNYFPDNMPRRQFYRPPERGFERKSTNAWPIGTNCAASGRKRRPETPVRAVTGKSLLFRKTGPLITHPPAIRPLPQFLPRRQADAYVPGAGPFRTHCGQLRPILAQNGFNVLPAISVPADLNRGRPLPASGGLHLHRSGGIQTPCPAATTALCLPRTDAMQKHRHRRKPSSPPEIRRKRNRASIQPNWLSLRIRAVRTAPAGYPSPLR